MVILWFFCKNKVFSVLIVLLTEYNVRMQFSEPLKINPVMIGSKASEMF
jgi:hypothetical protein